jgi:hypothetical protein
VIAKTAARLPASSVEALSALGSPWCQPPFGAKSTIGARAKYAAQGSREENKSRQEKMFLLFGESVLISPDVQAAFVSWIK